MNPSIIELENVSGIAVGSANCGGTRGVTAAEAAEAVPFTAGPFPPETAVVVAGSAAVAFTAVVVVFAGAAGVAFAAMVSIVPVLVWVAVATGRRGAGADAVASVVASVVATTIAGLATGRVPDAGTAGMAARASIVWSCSESVCSPFIRPLPLTKSGRDLARWSWKASRRCEDGHTRLRFAASDSWVGRCATPDLALPSRTVAVTGAN